MRNLFGALLLLLLIILLLEHSPFSNSKTYKYRIDGFVMNPSDDTGVKQAVAYTDTFEILNGAVTFTNSNGSRVIILPPLSITTQRK